MRQGVPQGGVLSPVLFNLYMAKMPLPPDDIKLVTYADDTTILISGPKIEPLCEKLNSYLQTLNDWFVQRNLFISPTKSSSTLFTTFSNESNIPLRINIDNTPVPVKNDPKILGITLDPLLTFKKHAANLKEKVTKRNNMLKALAGTTWGKEKETLVKTFPYTNI